MSGKDLQGWSHQQIRNKPTSNLPKRESQQACGRACGDYGSLGPFWATPAPGLCFAESDHPYFSISWGFTVLSKLSHCQADLQYLEVPTHSVLRKEVGPAKSVSSSNKPSFINGLGPLGRWKTLPARPNHQNSPLDWWSHDHPEKIQCLSHHSVTLTTQHTTAQTWPCIQVANMPRQWTQMYQFPTLAALSNCIIRFNQIPYQIRFLYQETITQQNSTVLQPFSLLHPSCERNGPDRMPPWFQALPVWRCPIKEWAPLGA